ncbi:hypothetical protein BC937DRAFT_88535 [Endogone sp. FLAS-F59071]|nr:hypothetical protein BC937DRAFT_91686 [Endogone sp. FLAS-F59071]RUS18626.1 hypothetical protein BC937DRAFT_88535 [Endogone sp. FLAS-F59071]|eukprot:RUS16025.1 hypothetical protein BC937DRAFT_91686 [Endogone sp. FLAS-F59071]
MCNLDPVDLKGCIVGLYHRAIYDTYDIAIDGQSLEKHEVLALGLLFKYYNIPYSYYAGNESFPLATKIFITNTTTYTTRFFSTVSFLTSPSACSSSTWPDHPAPPARWVPLPSPPPLPPPPPPPSLPPLPPLPTPPLQGLPPQRPPRAPPPLPGLPVLEPEARCPRCSDLP